MTFPESTSMLNDCNHPLTQSLTFSSLFPHVKEGYVTDRDVFCEVAMADSNNNSLKHCACNDVIEERLCPLADHNRWVRWAWNTLERHRLNGQKRAFKNTGDENLTEVQLKTEIENGDKELQKLLGPRKNLTPIF